jgi:hypothetical protein
VKKKGDQFTAKQKAQDFVVIWSIIYVAIKTKVNIFNALTFNAQLETECLQIIKYQKK